MLREYRLTNFKAFGETVTIPIRPLTLIFGANSSGKSSIFQSLLLLKQTLEEAKDPGTALLPKGSLVDLGMYRDFVHRHETERNLKFEAQFEAPLTSKIDKIQWPEASLGIEFVHLKEDRWMTVSRLGNLRPARVPEEDHRYSVSCEVTSISEEGERDLTHRYSASYEAASISEEGERDPMRLYLLDRGFLKSWLSVLEAYYREKDSESLARLIDLNFQGETLWGSEDMDMAREMAEGSIQAYVSEKGHSRSFDDYMREDISLQGFHKFLPFIFDRVNPYGLCRNPRLWAELPLERVVSNFRANLESLVYLGPLRSHPERLSTFSGDTTDYVGKSGENLPSLLFEEQDLVEQLNGDLERLGVKYQVKLDKLQYEDKSPSNVFSLRLVDTGTGIDASLRDVGFGISQVLPIVVQSRLSENKTLLIEQPEIHLHPAHQAELGDMFIRSALGEQKNTLLLETHSEHLLLRIMRRMRETSTGTLPEGAIAVRPEDVAVLFVESDGSQSIVREMPLDERGELVKAWPGGFFEEGLREIF